jgi:hypothetical protein
MTGHGDIEAVNIRTGESYRRVSGNGDSRLESTAFWAWREWCEKREKETTFRRQLSGTPGNMATDQFCFTEGFKQGVAWATVQAARERDEHP